MITDRNILLTEPSHNPGITGAVCLPDLVAQRAARTPGTVLILSPGRSGGLSCAQLLKQSEGIAWGFHVLSMSHVMGITSVIYSLMSGAEMVYAPAFDAARFFPMVRDVLPTWFTAPPAIDQALIAHAPDHLEFLKSHSPRFVRSGASPLPVALLNEIERIWNAPMVEAYGMSECPVISSNRAPPGPRKPGSIGLPCGVEVVLLDDSGRLLPRNTERVGEIAVRGPQVMDGYERNPDANAGAFIDGWFRTGDPGHFDDDGFLYYTGRRKEMINRASMKIAPLEVDQVILSHPSIADALTFSMPDARLGEDLGVAAVLRPGADTTVLELRWFAAEHLSEHNVPRRVVFVDQIPAGVTGKPQRIGLAANSECTSNPDPANARSLQRRAR